MEQHKMSQWEKTITLAIWGKDNQILIDRVVDAMNTGLRHGVVEVKIIYCERVIKLIGKIPSA